MEKDINNLKDTLYFNLFESEQLVLMNDDFLRGIAEVALKVKKGIYNTAMLAHEVDRLIDKICTVNNVLIEKIQVMQKVVKR